ncbi:MAG TPA: universal stress protein [Burkholderiales bacterium]|nr:universal stress protein [Burkholderiales bacterium]
MFRHLLIPTDGSVTALKAIIAGVAFAREVGAKVTGYHALPEPHVQHSADDEIDREIAARFAQRAQEEAAVFLKVIGDEAQTSDVECDLLATKAETPYRGIIDAAKDRGCDVIFMASHGRSGLPEQIMGSVTQKVLTLSTIPVLVYR